MTKTAILLSCILMPTAFAKEKAPKPNLHCENDSVAIHTHLSDDFEISGGYYVNKLGEKKEVSFGTDNGASHEVTKGPDKGMTEFELGVFETDCELFLRLKSARQFKHATLRNACGDGGNNSPIECSKE